MGNWAKPLGGNSRGDLTGAPLKEREMERPGSPTSVVEPLEGFDWVNDYAIPPREAVRPTPRKAGPAWAEAKTEGKLEDPVVPKFRGGSCAPGESALLHPAGPALLEYATSGCPVDCGRDWTPDEIRSCRRTRPTSNRPSSQTPSNKSGSRRTRSRSKGFAKIVLWDDIRDRLDDFPQLKVSPLSMIPHKSRKYRAILDLSFKLRIAGMALPSVNDATIQTAIQEAMNQLGTVLPRIIEAVANAPDDDGDILFAKLDIKDGFWRMVRAQWAPNGTSRTSSRKRREHRSAWSSRRHSKWDGANHPHSSARHQKRPRDVAQDTIDVGRGASHHTHWNTGWCHRTSGRTTTNGEHVREIPHGAGVLCR